MSTSIREWRRRPRFASLLVAALAASAVVSGCGGGDADQAKSASGGAAASTPASGGGPAEGAGLAAAKEALAGYKQLPTDTGVSEPIGKPAPTGKKMVYIYCGVPVCQALADGAKRAADVLGWDYETISTNGTPESVKTGWQTALRKNPDVVLASGFDTPVYAAELAELKKRGVYVGNYATTDPGPNGNVDVRIESPSSVATIGDQEAAWITVDTNGKANTLFVDVPSFTILKGVKQGFEDKYKEWCTGCKLDSLSLPITSLAKDAPQRVVSYLRAHPDVNYVAYALDAANVGLPAALKSAGLAGKVKFIGESPTPENFQAIANGDQAATVNQGYYEIQTVLVDGAVRKLLGKSLAPDQAYKEPYWIEAKDNLRSTKGFSPAVPDLYGKWAKAWGRQ